MKIFVDSSVLYSAMYSTTGASAELLRLSQFHPQKIKLIYSFYVLLEVQANLSSKASELLEYFEIFVDSIDPKQIIDPTKSQIEKVAKYTDIKDAPIVAAAIKSKVDLLATLDKKHLIRPLQVARKSKVKIVLPDQAFEQCRLCLNKNGAN